MVKFSFLIVLIAAVTSSYAQKLEGTWERTQYKFKRPQDVPTKPESPQKKMDKLLVFDSASIFTVTFYSPDAACQFDSTCDMSMEFSVDLGSFSEKDLGLNNVHKKSIKGKYTIQGDSIRLHGLTCYHYVRVQGNKLNITYYESQGGKYKMIGQEKYVRRRESDE